MRRRCVSGGLLSTALFALLATGPTLSMLPAQTPPCDALNDQTNVAFTGITGLSSSGPNRHAWQLTPATTIAARSVRVFTGHTLLGSLPATARPFMRLELWSDQGGSPGTRLAGGIWQLEPARPTSWQGTNFDLPVTMNANTPYWLVWIEPGWSLPPIQLTGAMLPNQRFSNGAWTPFGSEAVKYRIYCGLLDEQNVATAGAPCAGSAGVEGSLFTNELPTLGNSRFAVEGSGFPAGSFGFLVFGLLPGFPSAQLPGLPAGCMLHTDFAATTSGFTAGAPEAGHVRFAAPIPAAGTFLGTYFSPQLGVLDQGLATPVPLVTSNALRLTIF